MAQHTSVINSLGTMVGWNRITLRLFGRDVVGIRKVMYKDETEIESEYGAGKYPVGESEGNYKAEAEIELTLEEVIALQDALPRGQRLQDIAPFPITVAYEYQNRVRTDIINNCRFTGRSIDVKQGDKSIAAAYKLKVSHIDWNV